MNDANTAAPTAPRIVAECGNYRDLIQAFRRWFLDDGMRTTFATIDAVAGLPLGYTAKLCVGIKSIGPISLGPLLGAGGLKIQLVVDEEALARIKRHSAFKEADFKVPYSRLYAKRSMRSVPRSNPGHFTSEIARMLRARAMLMTSPKQRSEWARSAARIRWANVEAREGD